MKKRIAVLLTALLLVFTAVPFAITATAGDLHSDIPVDATTITIEDVEYTVVRDAAGFKGMTEKKNYILANNIDFGGVAFDKSIVTLAAGAVVDGNNYTISGYTVSSASTVVSTFAPSAGDQTVVRNLQIGKPDDYISFSSDGTGTSVSAVVSNVNNACAAISNVTVYANIKSDANNCGGIIGFQRGSKVSSITDCVFYGTVTGKFAGGIVGQSSGGYLTINNCINYGRIVCPNAGGAAGGIIGKNVKLNESANVIGTANYGTVISENYAGGFSGLVVGTTPALALKSFINTGMIRGTTAGGVIGLNDSANTITLDSCINTGAVIGTAVAAGLFGQYKDDATVTIKDSHSYGKVTAPSADAISTSAMQESSTGNKYIGTTTVATATQVTYADALSTLETTTTLAFIEGSRDTAGYPVLATPVYRGYQTTEVVDNKYSIRFLATVDSLRYNTVGFKIEISYTQGSTPVTKSKTIDCSNVYGAINVAGSDPVTAESLGGEYIIALTITGVPANVGAITFKVTPFANDGTLYTGSAYTVTVADTVIN